jgi:CRISPR-associated protein Cmr5
MSQSLDQKRAAFAWEKVSTMQGATEKDNYETAVKKCPARIMTNGLGQTLAYLKGSSQAGEKKLYGHLNEWLCQEAETLVWVKDNGEHCAERDEVVKRVIQVSSVIYRQATQETLAVLNWFKRYVDAVLP